MIAARRASALLALGAGFLLGTPAGAHEVRPAYLALKQTGAETYDVLWKVPAQAEQLRLGLDVRMPAGTVNVTEPMGRFAAGAFTERWTVRRPGGLVEGTIAIDGLSASVTDVLVRIERSDGTTQVTRVTPDGPSFVVAAASGSFQVVRTYVSLGVAHILLGVDHLLFVLGLLLIVRGRMMLLKTVTAFTVAHSLTLAIATLGYASAPLPPLNAAIALSILFLGPEVVRARRGETSLTIRAPWVVAFSFGLLHGFGFASGLSTTGMPHAAIPLALLCFNVGVELGQLLFVGLVIGMAWSWKRLEVRWPRWALAIPGYAVGTLGAFWTIQRTVLLFGGGR